MKGLVLFLASVAVATARIIEDTVTQERNDNTLSKVDRVRRFSFWPFSDPNEYACTIAPHVTFYAADESPPMPAYFCTNGNIKILLATRSFHLSYSPYDYSTYAKVSLEPSILNIEYPGAFTGTPPSLVYKSSKGTPKTDRIDVTGLLLLTDGELKRKKRFFSRSNPSLYSCQFVPSVNFLSETAGYLPVYLCIQGSSIILISTDSFRSPFDPNAFSETIDLDIGDDVLQQYLPGSFIQAPHTLFTGDPGVTHYGGKFFVQGLLRLTY